MSNYTPSTDFAAKDSLLSGNPAKVVKGTEFSAEFTSIAAAISSKYDSASVVPITSGGTGATVAATALTNLGAAKAGTNTDITSLGAVATISGTPNFSGAATGVTATTGDNSTKLATTAFVASSLSSQIQAISAVANTPTNGLTISSSTLSLSFRSAALGNGTITTVSGTPANLIISSGSTLGTVSAQQSRIVVLALNNAGTIELAAVNVSGGNDLSETGLISTTAEGGAGAADSANVIYSTTARSNVPYRVIGYIESTQATAGTWVTAPSTIQGCGGQALAAMSSLGYGQTWQVVTGSRAVSTTYYNTTGKPIFVNFQGNTGGAVTLTVNGATAAIGNQIIWAPIPQGASYSIAGVALASWQELR
jgi:hypothetical protein